MLSLAVNQTDRNEPNRKAGSQEACLGFGHVDINSDDDDDEDEEIRYLGRLNASNGSQIIKMKRMREMGDILLFLRIEIMWKKMSLYQTMSLDLEGRCWEGDQLICLWKEELNQLIQHVIELFSLGKISYLVLVPVLLRSPMVYLLAHPKVSNYLTCYFIYFFLSPNMILSLYPFE